MQVATPEQSYLGEAVALLPQSGIEGQRGEKISKKGKIKHFDFDKESINIQLGSKLPIYYQIMTKPSTFPSENQKTWPP